MTDSDSYKQIREDVETIRGKNPKLSVPRSRQPAIGERWLSVLNARLDEELNDLVADTVRMQGQLPNRAKPIGLFYDQPELVEQTDSDFYAKKNNPDADCSLAERKRWSLLESVYFCGRGRHFRAEANDYTDNLSDVPFSIDVLVPVGAQILQASFIEDPPMVGTMAEMEEYVEEILREIESMEVSSK